MAPDDPRSHDNLEWLDRFLAGEGTADERATWQRRIEGDPELAHLVGGLRGIEGIGDAAVRAEKPSAAPRWDVDAAWKEAVRRERVEARRRKARRWVAVYATGSWWTRSAIAAGILVAAASGVLVVTSQRSSETVGPEHEYATAVGERLNLTLSDGTELSLAPGSRLSVPVAYGRVARDVALDEGEAFFRVVHDGARPFRVRAGRATATDVGTAFDVRSYRGDTTVAIAVVEGRVAVTGDRGREHDVARSMSLGAGEVAAVAASGVVARVHEADLTPYVGWMRGELVFRDAPLADVARALERWYGVTIVLADPALARRPVLATYDMQSMTEVLTTLTATVGAHYTQTGRTITIAPGLAAGR